MFILCLLVVVVDGYDILGYDAVSAEPIDISTHVKYCTSSTETNCTSRKYYNYCEGNTCVACSSNPYAFTNLYVQNSHTTILISNTCSPPFSPGAVNWSYPITLSNAKLSCPSSTGCTIRGQCPILKLKNDVTVENIDFVCETDKSTAQSIVLKMEAIEILGPRNVLTNVNSYGGPLFFAPQYTDVSGLVVSGLNNRHSTGVFVNTRGDYSVICSIPVMIIRQTISGVGTLVGCSDYNLNQIFGNSPNLYGDREAHVKLVYDIAELSIQENIMSIAIFITFVLLVYIIVKIDFYYDMVLLLTKVKKYTS
jgi:hypothetical protein